jgi:hypothetical protein
MHLLLYLLLHAQVFGVVIVDGLMCDVQIAYTQRAYIQHEESRYNKKKDSKGKQKYYDRRGGIEIINI